MDSYYTDTTGNPHPPLQAPTPCTTRWQALQDSVIDKHFSKKPAGFYGEWWQYCIVIGLIILLIIASVVLALTPTGSL